MIFFIMKYLGWRNWSVLVYNSVFENMFLVFYIALRDHLYSLSFVLDFFFFLLFSTFSTTYGYLINDLADKHLDKLHGKKNSFEDDSTTKGSLIVLFCLLLSIVLGIRFIKNPFFLPLWLCWGLIATFYSLKPIRLKEKGRIGLIFAVIAQRVLPALLIFAAFRHYGLIDVAVFTTYITFRGLSSDLNHQLEDYDEDSVTKTDTYAVLAGLQKAQKIFRVSLEMEKSLLVVCLLIMYFELPSIQIYGISLLLPVLLIYLLLYGLNWLEIMSQGDNIDINPFVANRKNIFQFIHHTFPSVLLPFYLLLLLVYKEWLFSVVLLFFVVFRKMYSLKLIRSSFPVGTILNLKRS